MFKRFLKSKKASMIVIAAGVLSFLLFVLSLSYPTIREKNLKNQKAQHIAGQVTALSTAMTHYSSSELDALVNFNDTSVAYKELCALLTKTRNALGYSDIYAFAKGIEGYYYLLDSDYRTTGLAGTDYYSIGTPMKIGDRYPSNTRSVLDGIREKNSDYSYVTPTYDDAVISVYLPVLNDKDQVVCILGIDTSMGQVRYQQLGFINTTVMAVIFFILFVACCILYVLQDRSRKKSAALPPSDEE